MDDLGGAAGLRGGRGWSARGQARASMVVVWLVWHGRWVASRIWAMSIPLSSSTMAGVMPPPSKRLPDRLEKPLVGKSVKDFSSVTSSQQPGWRM